MADQAAIAVRRSAPQAGAVLELYKPITWFAPMWAFGCGVVSAGGTVPAHYAYIAGGILLAGPLVCGTSQAVNDWYDRDVDAINQPERVIPSGRVPGDWALRLAVTSTIAALAFSLLLGPWVAAAAAVGLALAWAYSAPPLRLKRNGWIGNAAVGLCYEGLPWFTAAAAVAGGYPGGKVVALALLYSLGAHGIMTLNDFKSIAGDRRMGIDSLPVLLGAGLAARVACIVMAAPQIAVVGLLLAWGFPVHAALVALALVAQGVLMLRFLRDPAGKAAWYSATGVTLYVLGMLAAAFALRTIAGA